MAQDQERPFELPVTSLLGLNTASVPTTLQVGQFRYLLNTYQAKNGSQTKRPGTVPVTTTALAATIKYLTEFKSSASNVSPDLIAASGTTLYKYNGTDTLTAQTMTNALNTDDIYTVAFTDANSVSILFITDGAAVKKYDGTAVTLITPAADDTLPAPPNKLADLNNDDPIYCWVHKSQMFISMGKDGIYYSKPFYFDYFPSVQFERFVRNNDYITGPGVTYSDVMLIPMRRGWGLLTGSDFDDFQGNQFLNTTTGCIAPRSIQRITYPNGAQTIFFLSDDGVYEIFDTGAIDSGSRQYATRSKMKELIDFDIVGFTDAEKKAATSYYDQTTNLYMLLIKRDTASYAYCLDVRNGQWYLWDNIKGESLVRHNSVLYYAGTTKHLVKFDPTLGQDWNESTKTTGTPVDMDIITDMIAFENTGYQSYLDWLVLYGKQYPDASIIDVTVVFYQTTQEVQDALNNQYMIWGEVPWGGGVWTSIDYTDFVGRPPRVKFKKKSFYFQIRFRNNRDELAELYGYRLVGRTSGG
jgi:hypothetical protein